MRVASASCLLLFVHWVRWAFARALANAGNSIAARMAMMAITTRSSINVKASFWFGAQPALLLEVMVNALIQSHTARIKRQPESGTANKPCSSGSGPICSSAGRMKKFALRTSESASTLPQDFGYDRWMKLAPFSRLAFLAACCGLAMPLRAPGAQPEERSVQVKPRGIDDFLANPGMGWQTFGQFADEDKALEGLPSASAYFRPIANSARRETRP